MFLLSFRFLWSSSKEFSHSRSSCVTSASLNPFGLIRSNTGFTLAWNSSTYNQLLSEVRDRSSKLGESFINTPYFHSQGCEKQRLQKARGRKAYIINIHIPSRDPHSADRSNTHNRSRYPQRLQCIQLRVKWPLSRKFHHRIVAFYVNQQQITKERGLWGGEVLRRAFLLWREAIKRPRPKVPTETASKEVALDRLTSSSLVVDIAGESVRVVMVRRDA